MSRLVKTRDQRVFAASQPREGPFCPGGETPARLRSKEHWAGRTTRPVSPAVPPLELRRKTNLMPNCTWRPGFAEVMTPKLDVAGLVPWKKLGRPSIGVLVTLMNCAMASTLALSPSWMCFERFRSAVASPGPRKEPMPQVPKCPVWPGRAETGFQNCRPRLSLGLGFKGSSGTILPLPSCETPAGQSARGDAEPVPELSGPSAVMAKPVWKVKAEPSDQPPMMVFTRFVASAANNLPLPKGRS